MACWLAVWKWLRLTGLGWRVIGAGEKVPGVGETRRPETGAVVTRRERAESHIW